MEVQALAKIVAGTMQTIAIGVIIGNIIFAFSLKQMWNLVGLLQYLVYLQLWKLNYPENAVAVLAYLKYIALMEFIPIKEIQDWISEKVGIDKTDPGNIINNMGTMFMIGGILLACVALLVVVLILVSTNYKLYKYYR